MVRDQILSKGICWLKLFAEDSCIVSQTIVEIIKNEYVCVFKHDVKAEDISTIGTCQLIVGASSSLNQTSSINCQKSRALVAADDVIIPPKKMEKLRVRSGYTSLSF